MMSCRIVRMIIAQDVSDSSLSSHTVSSQFHYTSLGVKVIKEVICVSLPTDLGTAWHSSTTLGQTLKVEGATNH